MIRVSLDWDAAREHVEQDEDMQNLVQSIERDLHEYVLRDGVDHVKRYLPTHYFDESGYRFHALMEDAGTWARNDVLNAMHRIAAAKIVQERIFGETCANDAFKQFVLGHHDT